MSTKTKTLPALFAALMLLLGLTATPAQAGEALEQLRGAWQMETVNGEQLPPQITLRVNFVDDATFIFSATVNGVEEEKEEVRYTATADGSMTIYEGETDTEGETGKWEIKDGKLVLTSMTDGQEEVVVMRRP